MNTHPGVQMIFPGLSKGLRYALVTVMALTALLPLPVFAGTNPVPSPAQAAVEPQRPDSRLLQTRSGGHILGFQPDKIYLAGMDHALRLEFLGTPGVAPQSAGSSATAGEGAFGAADELSRVTYTGLWPGVDLVYEATPDGIAKSTYTLAPGASVGRIHLRYNTSVALQADGSLRFEFKTGFLSESPPQAWQEIGGLRRAVQVAFSVTKQVVGFRLGAYDRRYPLVIDPRYTWHTFAGTTMHDYSYAMAVDSSNNVYLAGSSEATWTGPDWLYDTPLHAYSGSHDILVLKLDSAGDYVWHTFYGSSGGGDRAYGIAVDGSNVYVTGESSATWQGDSDTDPKHAHSIGIASDLMVLKLNTSGAYQWHTFYGSNNSDIGRGVAVDGGGNVCIVGYSTYSWLGEGSTAPKHAHSGVRDVFILKLESDGDYLWHTFYGQSTGDSIDEGKAVVPDGASNILVTGYSSYSWQGDLGANPIHAHSGVVNQNNLFVLKLDSDGDYLWHTFYRGQGTGIDVDGSDNVYVAGYNNASWLGDSGQSPLHAFSGTSANFVVLKLNSSGAYQWHTFFGSGASVSSAIVVSGANLYLTGESNYSWLGDSNASPLHAHSGSRDAAILALTSDGAYQWHTFYGSAQQDYSRGIAVDGSNNVYIGGYSFWTWKGSGDADPRHAHSGGTELMALSLAGASGAYRWHTFYGAGVKDFAEGIAVDGSSNVYIVGSGEYDSGNQDILVVKLDKMGAEQFKLFYGSSDIDVGTDIALDSSGNIYITGYSGASWLAGSGPKHDHSTGSNFDLVVIKLDKDGNFQWHTFYGSTSPDYGYGIAADTSGVVVAGYGQAIWQGDNNTEPKHAHSGGFDISVLKLETDGDYLWHTFYGSAIGDDFGLGIALDGSGYSYVTGYSESSWQGGTGSTHPKHAYTGGYDLFVLALEYDGDYWWHTFYGSGNNDQGLDIVVSSGNLYITGTSPASWQGDGLTNPKHTHSGSSDVLVLKLQSNGDYLWHTFYGSGGADEGMGIAVDSRGYPYITGCSYSSWQGDGSVEPVHAHSGGGDLLVLSLEGDGDYLWHTFYGSSASDNGYDIAMGAVRQAFVVGVSDLTWQGDGNANPVSSHLGDRDAFVLFLDDAEHIFLPLIRR